MAKKKITKRWQMWKKHPTKKGAEGHAKNLNKRKSIKAEVRKGNKVFVKKD